MGRAGQQSTARAELEQFHSHHRGNREFIYSVKDYLDDLFRERLAREITRAAIAQNVTTFTHVTKLEYCRPTQTRLALIKAGIAPKEAKRITIVAEEETDQAFGMILRKRAFTEPQITSIINYLRTIHNCANDNGLEPQTQATDNEAEDTYRSPRNTSRAWEIEQIDQMRAAIDHCPEYLDVLLDAAAFIIAHHPTPKLDTFHIYKLYEHQVGFIHLKNVIKVLATKGSKPNQIRAILNLHKHYGAALGPAFMFILKNIERLSKYPGGVLQLVADFADNKIPPEIQIAIVDQKDERFAEEDSSGIELALELAKRKVAPAVQEAIVHNRHDLSEYPGDWMGAVDDMEGFPPAIQVNLIYQIGNNRATSRYPSRPYILALAKLRPLNPECVDIVLAYRYRAVAKQYEQICPDPSQELCDLLTATSKEQLPRLTPTNRTDLFESLLCRLDYPHYKNLKKACIEAARLEHPEAIVRWIIDKVVQVIDMYDSTNSHERPDAPLPEVPDLVADLTQLANSDHQGTKASWYSMGLFYDVDRKDLVTVIQEPITDNEAHQKAPLTNSFRAIADKFFHATPEEKAKLTHLVAILVSNSGHYHLGMAMHRYHMPTEIICRYVFGIGPEVEADIDIHDIAYYAALLDAPQKRPPASETLRKIEKLHTPFPALYQHLYKEVAQTLRTHPETPIELAALYEEQERDERNQNLHQVLYDPSTAAQLTMSGFQQLVTLVGQASTLFPSRRDIFVTYQTKVGQASGVVRRYLAVGHTPAELAAGTGIVIIVPNVFTKELGTAMEQTYISLAPSDFGALAPKILTRYEAADIGATNPHRLGRLLMMLAETWPGPNGAPPRPDDNLGPAWQHVLEQMISMPGYPDIGAKIHVAKGVDPQLIELLIKELGLRSTPFRTIHAQKSVIIPPGRAIELQLFIKYLGYRGLFGEDDFDMQTCIGGRLQEHTQRDSVGILGSSMLLASEATPTYDKDAWKPEEKEHQTLTNCYIMAYGDGIRDKVPYACKSTGDRIDMLGRRDLHDLELYLRIATPLLHEQDGGPFADLGAQLRTEVGAILKGYQLYDQLHAAPWVFIPRITSRHPNATTQAHWEMVNAFTNIRIAAERFTDKSISGEVRRAVKKVSHLAAARFPEIIKNDPDEFERFCTL